MFLELCAGIASIQSVVGTNWRRTIQASDSINALHMPILPEDLKPQWRTSESISPVVEPMLKTESIQLKKLAWKWYTTPHGIRLHTIYVGKGYETWTLVWSRPEIHLLDTWSKYDK